MTTNHPRYEALLKIDGDLLEYTSMYGVAQGGVHDLRLLGFAQGLVDDERNDGFSEAEIFMMLTEGVNLSDDARWSEANYEYEEAKVEKFLTSQGVLCEPAETGYALHFGLIGHLTLDDGTREHVQAAVAPFGGEFHQDGDRFAEWGEQGLLELHDVTRMADISGHFMVYVNDATVAPASMIWSVLTNTIPTGTYRYLTAAQIAETGGPGARASDPWYVTTTIEDWSQHVRA